MNDLWFRIEESASSGAEEGAAPVPVEMAFNLSDVLPDGSFLISQAKAENNGPLPSGHQDTPVQIHMRLSVHHSGRLEAAEGLDAQHQGDDGITINGYLRDVAAIMRAVRFVPDGESPQNVTIDVDLFSEGQMLDQLKLLYDGGEGRLFRLPRLSGGEKIFIPVAEMHHGDDGLLYYSFQKRPLDAFDGANGLIRDLYEPSSAGAEDAPRVHRALLEREEIGASQEGAEVDFSGASSLTLSEDGAGALIPSLIVDAGDETGFLTLTLTLSNAAAGSLSTGSFGGVSSSFSGGVWSATGSAAAINTLLASTQFTPAANYYGTLTLTASVNGSIGDDTDDATLRVLSVNDAPTVANLIADGNAYVAAAYSFTVPVNSFSDLDGDSLTYAAQLNGGGALPGWLSFNAGTRSFSGTPALGDAGTYTIDVTASDGHGGSVTDTFQITVGDVLLLTNHNQALSYTEDLAAALADIDATTGRATITATLIVSNTAAGSLNTGTSGAVTSTYNAGTGIWTASGAIANVEALLAGLVFTPTVNFNGNFTIAVSVNDTVNTTNGTITVTGTPVNDAPVLAVALVDTQGFGQTEAWNYTVPGGSFTDVDTGDTLTYTATLSDGSALPAWLVFNAGTQSFSVGAGAGVVGNYEIRVTVTDSGGLTASDSFILGVAPNTLTGTVNVDILNGTAGIDIIVAKEANDTVYGNNGNDTIYGNAGNDLLHGDDWVGGANLNGNDLLYGDDGNDTIYCDDGNDTALGGGSDTAYGGIGNDYIAGYNGNDQLYGEDGNDQLFGGIDHDTLYGGAGTDYLYGDVGNDVLDGGAGADTLEGQGGADTLTGGGAADIFAFYNHTYSTIASPDIITDFEAGTDQLRVLIFNNIVFGAGNASGQTLEYYWDSGNTIVKSDGVTYDFSFVLQGTHTLTNANFFYLSDVGTAGNDVLTASTNPAGMLGLDGNDTITGSAGSDFIWGGDGNDVINANPSGGGYDMIDAGAGDDTIYVGGTVASSSYIVSYDDTITGGAGADVFKFVTSGSSVSHTWLRAHIADFEQGVDKLDVSGLPYIGVTSGAANGYELRTWYDAGAGVTIVQGVSTAMFNNSFTFELAGNITLTAADFIFDYYQNSGAFTVPGGETGIVGSIGNDSITTASGYMDINTAAGNDFVLVLGTGDKNITTWTGDDTVIGNFGGTGRLYLQDGGGTSFVLGGSGVDDIRTSSGNDTIYFLDGHDTRLQASSGHDLIYLGHGNESNYIRAESGNDTVYGEEGADMFGGGSNDDFLVGGYGKDTVVGGEHYDVNLYNQGVDRFVIFDPLESSNAVGFGDERDLIRGFSSTDGDVIQLHGFTGWNDGTGTTLAVSATLVNISGYNYTEIYNTSIGFSLLVMGDLRADWANAATRDNDIQLVAGDLETTGNDTATGAGGYLFGLQGDDSLTGSAGVDLIYGGHGADRLIGDAGADYLNGGYGNDTINGGAGRDTLVGSTGNDVFVFSSAADSAGIGNGDIIWDYRHSGEADKIDLSATGYAAGDLEIVHDFGITSAFTIVRDTATGGVNFEIWLLGYYEAGTDIDLTATYFTF